MNLKTEASKEGQTTDQRRWLRHLCMGTGKAGMCSLAAQFLSRLAGGPSPEAETGQAPTGSICWWVFRQRGKLGPGAVCISELMTQSLAQGETARSKISAGQDRYSRTKRRESPGKH